MTDQVSGEIEKYAYEKGAYYYFDKSMSLNTLKDKLQEIGIYRSFEKDLKL
jgi:hypothetical protein